VSQAPRQARSWLNSSPPQLGDVPDGFLVDGFRLARGVAGLA
jgi:hypothetical protein